MDGTDSERTLPMTSIVASEADAARDSVVFHKSFLMARLRRSGRFQVECYLENDVLGHGTYKLGRTMMIERIEDSDDMRVNGNSVQSIQQMQHS